MTVMTLFAHSAAFEAGV